MSTVNYVNKNNLPTSEELAKIMSTTSMDIIKKRRFDVGCKPSIKRMQELLRLERLVCSEYCYISKEDEEKIREQIIHQAILKLDEL